MVLGFSVCYGQEAAVSEPSPVEAARLGPPRIALFISEQNIEGPQKSWWASEVDLSATEAAMAQNLIILNCELVEPSVIRKKIKQTPAFRRIGISEEEIINLEGLSEIADYVVIGRPIREAADPRKATQEILQGIKEAI